MKKTSYTDSIKVIGASCIGKSHVACSIPNQDAYSIKKNRYGVAISVCDGVGSDKNSHFGSKAACKSVYKVFNLYRKQKIAKEDIGSKIEHYYKRYVKLKYRKNAATTCLFAMIYNNSEIIFGQAGDGIILIEVNGKLIVFQEKKDDFSNEVVPLTCNSKYQHWKIKNLKFDFKTNVSLKLIIATDGISEDIIPDKRHTFLNFYYDILKEKNASDILKKSIEEWKVPGSDDDKTMVVLSWESSNEHKSKR